jgi:hypothetical protein
MIESQRELFERQLLDLSQGMEYPRTPDVAGAVMRRIAGEGQGKGLRGAGDRGWLSKRRAWALMLIIVLCSSLMLIPPARAAVLEFIQIGVVRIFRAESTPLPAPQQELSSTPTAVPSAQPLIPILEKLAGEMTLGEAQGKVDYPILLPSYPPDLGPPDRVFVQDADGAMTILVWIDPGQPDKVLMSLHFLPSGSWAVKKIEPTLIRETQVNGLRAIWTVGPYPLRYSNGNIDFTRLVEGHVLIWAQGDVTYRLESRLSLEEAVRVAESLQPVR